MKGVDAKTVTVNAKSNLAFTLLCLPKERRKDMETFYAFCRVVDDIADEPGFTCEQRMEMLGEWKEGFLNGFLDPNPLQREVMALRKKYRISSELFVEIIKGMEMDVYGTEYATFDNLKRYCYLAASVVGLVCLKIFGANDPKSTHYAINLGYALQLTNIIRDVGEDYKMGRVYIPDEDLEKYNITKEDLISSADSRAFLDLMELQADRAEHYFKEAEANICAGDYASLKAARCMGRIYHLILEKIRKDRFKVFEKRYRIGKVRKIIALLGY
ncbi:squalene/phytoene synthase family protein [Verrucomicrobiales bacterium]|nr:squalene/phytoene synthase family protein [Verrucomicrobiales bacterium]